MIFGNCDESIHVACTMEDKTLQILITSYLCIWGWTIIFADKAVNLLYPFEFGFQLIAKLFGTWYNEHYKHHEIDFRVHDDYSKKNV